MTEKLDIQVREIIKSIPLERISQGAEAVVYRTKTHPYLSSAVQQLSLPSSSSSSSSLPLRCHSSASSYIVKYRPPKSYRHPILDASLTKHRTLAEARLLHKLGMLGVSVPRLVFADFRNGLLWMEDVGTQGSVDLEHENEQEQKQKQEQEEHDSGSNGSVKVWIWDQEKKRATTTTERDATATPADEMKSVLVDVGREIGKLHLNDVVHGDLTTSNIILRPRLKTPQQQEKTNSQLQSFDLEPVLIDFGLGSQSSLAEDKAVDLYVLERAVNSTHPVHSEVYNGWLLEGYTSFFTQEEENGKSEEGKKSTTETNGAVKIKEILRKLEDVRMRGRKRSMEG